jgi:hypothetical protein
MSLWGLFHIQTITESSASPYVFLLVEIIGKGLVSGEFFFKHSAETPVMTCSPVMF